jgi:hypothetical protein
MLKDIRRKSEALEKVQRRIIFGSDRNARLVLLDVFGNCINVVVQGILVGRGGPSRGSHTGPVTSCKE